MFDATPMSTTSHKSRTRILSEVAMKQRIHTSRADRDLTVDGLSKLHNEGVTLKVEAKTAKVKHRAEALASKKPPANRM